MKGASAARVLAVASTACLAVSGARAETRLYTLDIADGRDSAFEVEFRVDHAGTLGVRADWAGPRVISFRLEGPGTPGVAVRRSGPSPQRMEVRVGQEELEQGNVFKLTIRALSSRGEAKGTVRLDLPDSPEVVEERERAAEPPPPPPPEPDPWTVPKAQPPGADAAVARLFDSVERFRARVVLPQGSIVPDSCGWQSDLLRRMTSWRDAVAADGKPITELLASYLLRLAGIVRTVADMRTSSDPILAGPPPEGSLRLRAWTQLRRERIRPIERGLDDLAESLRESDAALLEQDPWLPRFVACLTACERNFEEAARVGPDEAAYGDLARSQWETILAAAEAFTAVTGAPQPAPSASADMPAATH